MKGLVLLIFIFLNLNVYAGLDDEISFLQEQKKYNELTQEINLNHLKYFKICLEDESREFVKQVITKDGNLKEKKVSCQKVRSYIFNNRIEDEYRRLRIVMALMQPELRENPYLMEGKDLLAYKMNINIEHLNTASFASLPFETTELDPLVYDEIKEAIYLYNKYTYLFCGKFVKDKLPLLLKKNRDMISKDKGVLLTKQFCGNNIQDLLEKNNEIKSTLKAIIKKYYTFSYHRRNEVRKLLKLEYYSLVNATPYFLLLSSQNPKTNELIDAITTIYQNAYSLKNEWIRNIINSSFNQKAKKYQNGKMSNSEKQDFKNLLLKFYKNSSSIEHFEWLYKKELKKGIKLQNRYNSVIYEQLMNTKNEKILEDTYFNEKLSQYVKMDQLTNQIKSDIEMTKMATELGIMAFVTGACFFPVSKIFKALGIVKFTRLGKYFRRGCFLSFGMPLNTYFLLYGIEQYKSDLKKFLSSADGKYFQLDYNSVGANKIGVILPVLLMGVGTKEILRTYKLVQRFYSLKVPSALL
ncbi:MAG: hypothetical protein HON90_10505 [Halobacteriovoraceae bacterium]|jgi:hypothetical protein|nr:hypothetical protein [Halobacteriovoraceae bacterium]